MEDKLILKELISKSSSIKDKLKKPPHREENKSYWLKLLAGFTNFPLLGIKKNIADNAAQPVYAEKSLIIAPELQADIDQFLTTHQINAAVLLQGVWGCLVGRYSGSEDVTFGSTGLPALVNIFPVRLQIKPAQTRLEYLRELQQQIIESCWHASVAEIHDFNEFSPDVELFDHIFKFENELTEGTNESITNYSLAVIAGHEEKLVIRIKFNKNYYAEAAIQSLLSHYCVLLKSIIEAPENTLLDAAILSAEEQQKMLIDWNQTAADYPQDKNIQQLFEERVKQSPDNVALVYDKQTLTYRELNEKVNQLAHFLRKFGVKPDGRLAICMEPSFDLIIGILAILKAGCAYVPLDPHYPPARLQYMLEDSHAGILITHSALVSQFKNAHTRRVCVDALASQLAEQVVTDPAPVNHPDNLAYIIYTSGSTGNPKGVMITHRNVCNFIQWFGQALAVTHDDIVDFSTSISFDFSVATTLFPIVKGARIAICAEINKKDPNLYINHLLQQQVSIIKITPSYFRQLKEFISDQKLSHLRFIVFGGESSLSKDIKEWLDLFPNHKILNEYGPTEATVATSWILVEKNNIHQFANAVPIGKPALNSQLYILDKHLQPVPVGIEGELYIGGVGVAKGYLNRPDVSAIKFIKNPFSSDHAARLYKTGDLCRYLPDGNIEFIGRVDHQVKIRGFRIETAEIEMYLASHPAIKEAAVMAQEDHTDQTGEKRLIVYYVPIDLKSAPGWRELRQYLQQNLPDYMIPTMFVMMEAFPLSPNGKLDRKALTIPDLSTNQHYLAPRTPLEQIVEDIWSEVLNIRQISVNDNFFELGGHSLSAARIISKIAKIKNKEIKLNDFYNAPTISELANIITHAKDISKRSLHFYGKPDDSRKVALSDMQFLLWLAQKTYSKEKGLNVVHRKRMSGKLDINALNFAFKCVFEKHEILGYYISPYWPAQYAQKITDFPVLEKDISHLSEQQKESVLSASRDEMKKYHNWKKRSPSIMASLFYLGGDISELQICMSHMISDEVSPEILFLDLSRIYVAYKNNVEIDHHPESVSYKEYVLLERDNLNITLEKDLAFWEDYLRDTTFFSFPAEEVMEDKELKNVFGSTYIELPEQILRRLQIFCVENRLSLSDSLCAAVGLVLGKYLDNGKSAANKAMAMNIVKSTRDNDIFDHTIGFFVRTDVIKMDLNDQPGFIELSKRVQTSVAETAPHQFCPGIVKLACSFKKKWEHKRTGNNLISICAFIFTRLFYRLKLNHQVLMMYGRMFLAGTKPNFLVQVNVLNNFILNNNLNPNLFGFKPLQVASAQEDRMVAKNVLDICFDRDNQNKAYLILSGNLRPAFREKIGREIIRIISE